MLISLSCAELFSLLGLFLDTLRPRFDWDNPLKALKSKPNALLSVLASRWTGWEA